MTGSEEAVLVDVAEDGVGLAEVGVAVLVCLDGLVLSKNPFLNPEKTPLSRAFTEDAVLTPGAVCALESSSGSNSKRDGVSVSMTFGVLAA